MANGRLIFNPTLDETPTQPPAEFFSSPEGHKKNCYSTLTFCFEARRSGGRATPESYME